jgi:hypothetical protein
LLAALVKEEFLMANARCAHHILVLKMAMHTVQLTLAQQMLSLPTSEHVPLAQFTQSQMLPEGAAKEGWLLAVQEKSFPET